MNTPKLELLDPKVIETFGTHLKYILVECKECGRHWGVNVEDNTVRKDQLVCQVCAANQIAKSI